MSQPLVSVVCLCYNQARFVGEAITSVLTQTHSNIELIVVDDGSTDESKEVIRAIVHVHPEIVFLPLPYNIGNCRAFNQALPLINGDYVIDLAADDVLDPRRIERGLEAFESRPKVYGVNFTDALLINAEGTAIGVHSEKYPHESIPSGDVYRALIQRFFICPPTMMFRRRVIDSLGGYDEELAYEDFDFWIRSSRNFQYCYTPEILVKKRVVADSLSAKQFQRRSPQLKSTYLVCKKIFRLNQTSDEKNALTRRLILEISTCIRLRAVTIAIDYARLLLKNLMKRYKE